MVWYPVIGWPVMFLTIILTVILTLIYRKLYPVFYMISIFLYIFTVAFMIDVFNFDKLPILLTLVFSAFIFMGLGYYLSKVLVGLKPIHHNG